MDIHTWLAFCAASAVLLAIPGPTILLVIGYAIAHGRRTALAIIAGVALGDFVAMTASMVGVGALLAASAEVFTVLRWAGAAYLVYLGWRMWRAPVAEEKPADGSAIAEVSRLTAFGHAFVVTALNPKGLVFFVAFLPQFLDASAPVVPQLLILGASFLVLGFLNASSYALLAEVARRRLTRPSTRRLFNRTGGSLLIGAGILTAAWRRA